MKAKLTHLAALIAAMPLSGTVLATPPAASAYVSDPQNVYVQDATSDSMSQMNMVLCIMNAMQPASFVNAGPYVALVDKNKCDTSKRASSSNSSSSSSGTSAAPDYMNAIVNVTRATNADPMISKIWMSMSEDTGNGKKDVTIYVRVSASQSPSDAPPYGVFRLDYLGRSNGATMFNGFIDSSTGGISYFENSSDGGGNQTTALTLSAASSTAGSGSLARVGGGNPSVNFDFSYNTGFFRRTDGSNDYCFDRSGVNAKRSVWRYGTYDATSGDRIDQANPGFPIRATYNGTDYFGFANYWGINFQGADVTALPDGTINATITDQRPGNNSTYALSKISGKLTKYTRNTTSLAAVDGMPFQTFGDLAVMTGTGTPGTSNSYVLQWDDAHQHFVVTGQQSCGNNGCVVIPLGGGNVNVVDSYFYYQPVFGWSEAVGGNVNIPPRVDHAAHTSTDGVLYFTQSVVAPGSIGAPTNLNCLSRCPTYNSLKGGAQNFAAGTNTGGGQNVPWGNRTGSQWNFAQPDATSPFAVHTVSYTFGASGLSDTNGAITLSSPRSVFSGNFQGGIQTGNLFDVPLPNCPSGMPGGSSSKCEPSTDPIAAGSVDHYYVWETGPNNWNQTMVMTKTSVTPNTVVSFDAPENIPFSVPPSAPYPTSWQGKVIQLQFNGFGNLWGIPGQCVSPDDNSEKGDDCSGSNARWVPRFSLTDGTTLTRTGGKPQMIVKALDAEQRLSKVACSGTGLLPTTHLTVPTGGTHDPSASADAYYIGTAPTVTAAPKVIHGVLQ